MKGKDGVMELDDIGVLEILNNSTRLKILSNLEEPSSVKAVAEAMGVPPTRLYYHINLLADAGLIEVVETRKVGAMIERLYQSVAGKSTLVKQVIGLLKPTSGTINLGDHDLVADPNAARQLCSYLPQAPMPIESFKVHEAVRLTGEIRVVNVLQLRREPMN